MIFRTLLLLVLISIHQTSCCLSCMEESNEKLRELQAIFNEKNEDNLPFVMIKTSAMQLFNQMVEGLATEHLDSYSMNQMEMEFKKVADLIENSELEGMPLLSYIGNQYSKVYARFIQIYRRQLTERFCPNLKSVMKCGMMEQTVTHCGSCKQQKNLCVGGSERCREKLSQCPMCLCDSTGKCHDMRNGKSCTPCEGFTECLSESLNCGARYLEVEEHEDIVFDCSLDWHHKLENRLEYVYEKLSNRKSKVLSTTDEHILEKKFSSKSDEGEYRCTARLFNKLPVSTLTYNVKIIPSRIIYYKTRPTLPPEETTPTVKTTGLSMEQKFTYGAIILTAVCGFCLLLLIFAISIYTYCKRQHQDQVKPQSAL